MKIDKLLNSNTRLVELILLNFFFKKDSSANSANFSEIATRIKKILHIIYKYHKFNKKILFLGTPVKSHYSIEKILKQTKHIAIPESVWVNGLLTNKKYCLKYLVKKQIYSKNTVRKLLLKFKKQIDLILVMNNIDNKSLAQEISNSQIPVIYLSTSEKSELSLINSNYTLEVNFSSKKILFNFFFSMLKTLIKRPQKKTKINYYEK